MWTQACVAWKGKVLFPEMTITESARNDMICTTFLFWSMYMCGV